MTAQYFTGKAEEHFKEWARRNGHANMLESYRVVLSAIAVFWLDTQNIVIQVFPQLSECVCYVKEYQTLDEIRIHWMGPRARLNCTEKALKVGGELYNDRFKDND